MKFVPVYPDPLSLAGVLVAYYEFGIAQILLYRQNRTEMAAALPALETFKRRDRPPPCKPVNSRTSL